MDAIKEVVGVSIGSSRRDHTVEIDILGETFRISRRGTDGDMQAAEKILRDLDGSVAAFGLGGIDLFLHAAGRDYHFRDAKRFRRAVAKTPIVDGSGLKGAVEADVVRHMAEDLSLELSGKRVLITSAVDRWGMAMAFADAGCRMSYGDLLYALGLPVMIHRRRALERVVHAIAPIAVQLPFQWLYEADADDTTAVKSDSRHARLYEDADIIAGDYKYVRRYMPKDMSGKWVVTNTTTPGDVEFMRNAGVELLVTSTPRLDGRTFGTNIIEATLVAAEGASEPMSPARYSELLRLCDFAPDCQWLQSGRSATQTERATPFETAPASA